MDALSKSKLDRLTIGVLAAAFGVILIFVQKFFISLIAAMALTGAMVALIRQRLILARFGVVTVIEREKRPVMYWCMVTLLASVFAMIVVYERKIWR